MINERLDIINPQDPTHKKKLINESELEYYIDLLKSNSINNLDDLHMRAVWTAKVLTTEMIEGKLPICFLLE
jgi:hypothetical protein